MNVDLFKVKLVEPDDDASVFQLFWVCTTRTLSLTESDNRSEMGARCETVLKEISEEEWPIRPRFLTADENANNRKEWVERIRKLFCKDYPGQYFCAITTTAQAPLTPQIPQQPTTTSGGFVAEHMRLIIGGVVLAAVGGLVVCAVLMCLRAKKKPPPPPPPRRSGRSRMDSVSKSRSRSTMSKVDRKKKMKKKKKKASEKSEKEEEEESEVKEVEKTKTGDEPTITDVSGTNTGS
ncbi:unnamed protein product [Caenorhabditis sp. 36 PRJEB53466]|nr:unnamed protein product [Caenorhabditis sp. 36 PRJEB53466]